MSRILHFFLGLVFVVSALAKLMAIDFFEIYIFSYGFFSLNLVYLLARLCIAAELLLGVGLWVRVTRRQSAWLSFGLLTLFTIFLCYAALIGRTDSCQCMGRLVDLPPAASILKNALLMLLFLWAFRLSRRSAAQHPSGNEPAISTLQTDACQPDPVLVRDTDGGQQEAQSGVRPTSGGRRWRRLVVLVLLAVVLVAVPFVVSVPDNWMFGASSERYNDSEFHVAVVENEVFSSYRLASGPKLVAFFTPGCPYCKLAKEKIETIVKRHHIDSQRVVFLYPETISSSTFLKITYGQWPLILLMSDGQVVETFHYRNIDESEIVRQIGR